MSQLSNSIPKNVLFNFRVTQIPASYTALPTRGYHSRETDWTVDMIRPTSGNPANATFVFTQINSICLPRTAYHPPGDLLLYSGQPRDVVLSTCTTQAQLEYSLEVLVLVLAATGLHCVCDSILYTSLLTYTGCQMLGEKKTTYA